MDLPGIHFNMASERITIEHNVFETVCAFMSLNAGHEGHTQQGAGVSIGSEMSGSVRDVRIVNNVFLTSQCVPMLY